MAKKAKERMTRCDDCGRHFPEGKLDEYQDFWSRTEAGGEIPAGDCPRCGAFCYLVKEPLTVVLQLEGGLIQASCVPDGVRLDVLDYDELDPSREDYHKRCARGSGPHHHHELGNDWDGKAVKR
jgi:hypothetical protein